MKHLGCAATLALALFVATGTGHAAALTLAAGTTISVRMLDSLDSNRNYAGESFRATLNSPLMAGERVVVPQGAEAIGKLVAVERPGRIQGRPMIAMELTALNFHGQSFAVQTGSYQEAGPSQGKRTSIMAGGGGVLGTVIGGIAGGVTGLLIGAHIGAAGGAIVQTVRGAKQISIPAESLVTFTLLSPISFDAGL